MDQLGEEGEELMTDQPFISIRAWPFRMIIPSAQVRTTSTFQHHYKQHQHLLVVSRKKDFAFVENVQYQDIFRLAELPWGQDQLSNSIILFIRLRKQDKRKIEVFTFVFSTQ